jgi:bifunctional non-homologous end joining protein LigD
MSRVHARLDFIEPQLPSLVDQPPEGEQWIHEIKHDGYRSQVLLERGRARVITRNGFDWTERYPSFVQAASKLSCNSAIIDGEAIVQNCDGVSDFEALGSALRQRPHTIILYAFDLLHLDGKDLRKKPLMERRACLRGLIEADDEIRIQFSDHYDGDGASLFAACAKQGLEGIVSKQAQSPYRSGRSKTWLKTKCFAKSTFVVVGTDRDRKTGALRALLASPDEGGLRYAGAAFIAISGEERAQFFGEIERLKTLHALFKKWRNDVKWCHPKLTVEVKYLPGGKTLRHATVKRLAS